MAKKTKSLDLWWIENWECDVAVASLQFARQIMKIANDPLVLTLAYDQVSQKNRLTLSLVFRSRLLHLAWVNPIYKEFGAKAFLHVALLKEISPLVPGDSEVILLAGSEYYCEVSEWVQAHTTWRLILSNWQNSLIQQGQVW